MLVRVRISPRSFLWSERRSFRCRPSLSPGPQLSAVLACCCFQATLRCYSRSVPSIPITDRLPAPGPEAAVWRKPDAGSRIALPYRPNPDHRRDGDKTGSGHRGNTETVLRMVGCEVVMATGELLNSACRSLPFVHHPLHFQ